MSNFWVIQDEIYLKFISLHRVLVKNCTYNIAFVVSIDPFDHFQSDCFMLTDYRSIPTIDDTEQQGSHRIHLGCMRCIWHGEQSTVLRLSICCHRWTHFWPHWSNFRCNWVDNKSFKVLWRLSKRSWDFTQKSQDFISLRFIRFPLILNSLRVQSAGNTKKKKQFSNLDFNRRLYVVQLNLTIIHFHRFPYIFGAVSPKYAAQETIKAIGRNYAKYSIPRGLMILDSINRYPWFVWVVIPYV